MLTPLIENKLPYLIRLEARLHKRVWGGARLDPDATEPIGEAWIVHDDNRIAGSDLTLRDLVCRYGRTLLGSAAAADESRFPLLIKFLDCHGWLSVQVHPDDAQAAALEGHGQRGKTEAWHVVDAAPGATLLAGLRDGVSKHALEDAIRAGRVLDVCVRHAAQAGDTFYLPAGTMHALGPGLFVYEVQQNSDITYRVWDWDRPASAGRALHVPQSLAVADVNGRAIKHRSAPALETPDSGAIVTLLGGRYFKLSKLTLGNALHHLSGNGESFLAITSLNTIASVKCAGEAEPIAPLQTVIVPACAPPVAITGTGDVLVARL